MLEAIGFIVLILLWSLILRALIYWSVDHWSGPGRRDP